MPLMERQRLGFGKAEKLKRSKAIDALFARGLRLRAHPFQMLYLPAPAKVGPHQAMFVAPRRIAPLAVQRNRIKRQTREAYRLSKALLKDCPKLWIGFVYQSKTAVSYTQIQRSIDRLMRALQQAMEKTASECV